ncbi:MAG: HEAT repeat domain-containing protein, partial [Calditrichaeota bacterium]|nr:HEAT repeat domain-containing protein [Calditrichota bacterium]
INIVGCVIDAAETGKISLQTGARFALGLAVEYLQTDEYLKMDQGIMQMGRFVKENYHFLDVESKLAAVEIFGKFRLPEFLAVLRAALQDNEAIARSTALEMVQHTGTDQFEDLLAQLQSDEDENIRKLAVALS